MCAQNTAPAFRVRFVHDDDAQFEECNGEARPLTEEEYAQNGYCGCPVHPRSKVPPVDVSHGQARCGECGNYYEDIPYAEYLAYYGNPDRYVYIACQVQKGCECCGTFSEAAALYHIDLMDDSPELDAITLSPAEWFTPEQASQLPGYLADVAREELAEAGYEVPR